MSAALTEGRILAGRFELVRLLGAGGLAEVWVARDLRAGGEVAIKALHAHLVADEGLAERFRRELGVTRGLSHAGIVRVFDLYEHAEQGVRRPFFAMELLRGRPLSEALRAGPFPLDEARRIAREIALALEHAHRAGVVHRDLKPHNVWLCEDGSVKLLDFGLARAAGWSRLTAQNTLMGTPGYIAPETLQGTSADGRADLYALGATFFEMLTGKRAFPSADPYTALRRKNEPLPSARALRPEVSEEDEAAVRRALEPDPENRFLEAGQFARALEGKGAAPAHPAPAGLTRGDRDVVIVHSWKRQKKALRRVCERLAIEMPGLGWRARLAVTGRNMLIAGASSETAESVSAICREEGLAVSVEPARPIGKLRRWLAAQGGKATAAMALLAGAIANYHALQDWVFQWPVPLEEYVGRFRARGLSERLLKEMAEHWRAIPYLHSKVAAFFHELQFFLPAAGVAALLVIASASLRHLWELPPAIGQALAAPKPRGKFRRWLAKRANAAALAAGLATLAGLVLVGPLTAGHLLDLRWLLARMGHFLSFLAMPALGVALLARLLLSLERPAPHEMPEGDANVRRLQRGIAQRVQRLRKAAEDAQPASQAVLADLAQAARGMLDAADQLADRAATAVDPLSARAEAVTLPPHAGADRDAAVDELLRMAAALDEAVAAADGPRPPDEALDRLRAHAAAPGATPVTGIAPPRERA